MQQIRGIKVKPDAEEGTSISSDADKHASDKQMKERKSDFSQTARTAVSSQMGLTSRSKTAEKSHNKSVTKSRNAKTDVDRERASSAENSSSRQCNSNKTSSTECMTAHTVSDASALVSLTSSDTQTAAEMLRTCARCQKQESASHEFKKCKK